MAKAAKNGKKPVPAKGKAPAGKPSKTSGAASGKKGAPRPAGGSSGGSSKGRVEKKAAPVKAAAKPVAKVVAKAKAPLVAKKPEAKKPEVKKQAEVKKPEVKKPEVKKPEAKKVEAGKPAVAGKPAAAKPVETKVETKVDAKAVAAVKAGAAAAEANAGGKKKGGKVKAPPVIAAKPGQILLTRVKPLTPEEIAAAQAAKAAAPAVTAAVVDVVKKVKAPVMNLPLPPAPVTSDSKAKKNQAGLTVKELEHYRDLLLARRRELVGDMSSMEREALRGGGSTLSNLPVHMADMGTDNYEQEFTLGLVEKERQQLREINTALAKIQNGTFGICEGTGKPISKPRLEAQPWTRYSIEYARTLEQRGGFRR